MSAAVPSPKNLKKVDVNLFNGHYKKYISALTSKAKRESVGNVYMQVWSSTHLAVQILLRCKKQGPLVQQGKLLQHQKNVKTMT